MKKLGRSFFNRDTNVVARELLGKKIVRVFDNGERIEAIIAETEAYHGFDDKASHASRKKTERNKIMFDKPGLVYVYLIYGMHHCLNFVTMKKDFPAAVLIRSIALPVETQNFASLRSSTKDIYTIQGPGRVCKALDIDRSFYGEDLTTSKKIWIEPVGLPAGRQGRHYIAPKHKITASKRIGIPYAEECKDWEWNYKIKNDII